jgi:MarR family transcriptional regulator, negative regulator of the multidrug operon emrRAB
MSFDAIATLEQNLSHVGQRCPDFPVDLSRVTRLVKLVGWHMTSTGNSVLNPWGITFNEYNVLTLLYGHAEHTMSATELNGVIGEAPNSSHRLIHLLQKRGLVVRSYDETDRRKLVVKLSDAGLQLMQEMLPVVSGVTGYAVRSFAPGELVEFARLLKILMKAITA